MPEPENNCPQLPLEISWGQSGDTKKHELMYRKADSTRSFMVVPTGLFPAKNGIYMPNNYKGLDRRPLCI